MRAPTRSRRRVKQVLQKVFLCKRLKRDAH
nr:MAG TPA: hypothetical protein [Caudoviricetes sp.]